MSFTSILLIIVAIQFLWLGAISYLFFIAHRKYQKLTQGVSKKDLTNTLIQIKQHLKHLDRDLDDFRSSLKNTNQAIKTHIQKLGFIRYNPFGNTGGDQSFSLCLLDQNDNGILLTSLHAREQTRIYTKQIKKGSPLDKSELSKEEANCLKQAVKGGK